MREAFFIIAFLKVFAAGISQTDTAGQLPMVLITEESTRPNEGLVVEQNDSLGQIQFAHLNNLGDYLSEHSALFIKRSGPSSSASPTFRGGNANHTQLLWNGARLNSPLLGQADFSMFLLSDLGSVKLVSGATANRFTSGGLGGVLMLDSKEISSKPAFSSHYGFGSFATQQYGVSAEAPLLNKQLKVRLSLNQFSALNDFQFVNIYDGEPFADTMQHASIAQQSAQLQVEWSPSSKLKVKMSAWHQLANRALPNPQSVEKKSQQYQSDQSNRAQFIAYYTLAKWQLSIMSFLERNYNLYSDFRTNIEGNNTFTSNQNQLAATYFLNSKSRAQYRANGDIQKASSLNYVSDTSLFILSHALSLFQDVGDRLMLEGGVRQERNTTSAPLLPFGGATLQLTNAKALFIGINYSKNVRFPTINELHWNPGGNQNLKPERGSLIEFNAFGESIICKALVTYRLAAYRGEYEDWILWRPNGPFVFSPFNIQNVLTRGIEARTQMKRSFGSASSLKVFANYTYTRATAQGSTSETQLIYVPLHQATLGSEFGYRNWLLKYTHAVVGKRFVSSENTSFLPAYNLGNIVLSTPKVSVESLLIEAAISVRNLWDWNYQVLPWYGMPGRNFSLSINISSS